MRRVHENSPLGLFPELPAVEFLCSFGEGKAYLDNALAFRIDETYHGSCYVSVPEGTHEIELHVPLRGDN